MDMLDMTVCDEETRGYDPHSLSSLALTRHAILATQMEAVYHASQALTSTTTLAGAMKAILEILDSRAAMGRGVITLVDNKSGGLLVRAIHDGQSLPTKKVFYRPDEGMLGVIVKSGQPVIVEDPTREPRFIHRLGLLDPGLPFIGVPIPLNGSDVAGVLAAQPRVGNRNMLADQTMMLEIIANMLAQRIRGCRETSGCRFREDSDNGIPVGFLDDPRPRSAAPSGYDPRREILTRSARMEPVFERIEQAARWDAPVLIQGESGTGKERVASAIHRLGERTRERPFVKVNCAALPDTLLESELFGHEKGAFTGAVTAKPGRFELADGGTLFLDEIGEISPAFQSKLLRVLQEGEFERVGGIRTLKVKVRIITATHADLYARVQEGQFRADLFYRLFVLPIALPPLRERSEDIPLLTEHFLGRLATAQKRSLRLTQQALEVLRHNPWLGNVRELENCLERAAVMSRDGTIDAALIQFPGPLDIPGLRPALAAPTSAPSPDLDSPTLNERERVLAALERAGWVQAKAARLLGMTPRQIAYRVRVLDIPMRQI
ncbi:MAG: nif-specific transcriptional activator NifA [Magnetococcus sp. WYHC-3]